MEISIFTFNAFEENTYLLSDETGECIIVDPGCSNKEEENRLQNYIVNKKLNPVRLINTHCHIDHVLGNKFVSELFGLELEAHRGEIPVLDANVMVANMYGVNYIPSPPISKFIEDNDIIKFGQTELQVLFTPGHSPASISLFHKDSGQLIAGDVLFHGSIGRTDLPGGNFDTLIQSIKTRYYPLGDDVIVYPGHGPSTTIIEEKIRNPFLQ